MHANRFTSFQRRRPSMQSSRLDPRESAGFCVKAHSLDAITLLYLSEHNSHIRCSHMTIFPANDTLLNSAAMQSHVDSKSIISSTSDTFPPPNRRLRILFPPCTHAPQRFIWLSAKILLDYVAQANCNRCFPSSSSLWERKEKNQFHMHRGR